MLVGVREEMAMQEEDEEKVEREEVLMAVKVKAGNEI